MGFFSKVCAKTNMPVIHHGYKDDWHSRYPEFYEVVVLFPDGRKVEGAYDGYGRVGEINLLGDNYDNAGIWDSLKFVLKKYYNGEAYSALGKSQDELAQGHFMDEEFIFYCRMMRPQGFKNYGEYKREFKKRANW